MPLALAPIFDHNLSLSAALADYDRFAAGETDSLYLDWCRLADSQPESIASMELPVINRQVIESLLNPIHVPGFPEEEKQRVIGILAARWEKLREQISQYRTSPEHK